ncbi:helix-turn-helix domain-containing protein [Catenuloplanes sp. NPDC051500]|uniref:helix-turn-helix domain-containing protein n=1 Tax=Catenuloplanes sp. NPDC051500 TaxID=3363959 RepID=UPI0037B2DC22
MPPPKSPTVRRLRLGSELRQLRRAAALTLEQVCDRLGWASTSKLSRIELGQSRPDLADIMDLLDVYDVDGHDRDKLIVIARDAAAARGWWKALGDMGPRQRRYAELETGAADIFEFHQYVVPGLLQTPEYGRVRVRSGRALYPALDLDADSRARAARHVVLRREAPPRYEAVIDESAFHRQVAPPEVMRGQMRHLLAMADLPNVVLRVLPFRTVLQDAYVPHTAFSVYSFPDPADPRTVVLETMSEDVHLTDEDEVSRYLLVADWLRAAALPEEESRAFLTRVAETTRPEQARVVPAQRGVNGVG